MIAFGTYNSMYVNGAKKVSVRSYYENKDSLEKAHGNYDLLFSVNGQLKRSTHNEKHKIFEIDYIFDSKGKFLKAEQRNSVTQELEQIAEYTYDRKGRVQIEKYQSYYPRLTVKVSNQRIVHFYKELAEITVMTSDEDDQYTTYYNYNINGSLIEEKSFYKREGFHEWIRYEYDENGKRIRDIWLYENAELYFSHEYLPRQNGLFTGYKCVSIENNYLREYSYTFNDRGHWINEVIKNDGVPRNKCNRIIEYY